VVLYLFEDVDFDHDGVLNIEREADIFQRFMELQKIEIFSYMKNPGSDDATSS